MWWNLHFCSRGPIKSVLFICPSACLSVHLWCGSTQWIFYFFLWECFAIYTKKWQSNCLENCIFCVDNWLSETNLEPKWNIWHFNEGNITFRALNDALNNCLYDFVKTVCLGKICFSNYRPIYFPQIRLKDFLNFNTSKTIGGIMFIFCM